MKFAEICIIADNVLSVKAKPLTNELECSQGALPQSYSQRYSPAPVGWAEGLDCVIPSKALATQGLFLVDRKTTFMNIKG